MRLEHRLPNITDYKRLRDLVGWQEINEIPNYFSEKKRAYRS